MMFATLRLIAVGVVLLLSQAIYAEDDAHDKLVYGRYARTLSPSGVKVLVTRTTIEMKTTQLDRPATKKDVEAGRAVFTFEGLGETRIWKLPEPSLSAVWTTLSTPTFICSGWVCQAEEFNVGGKWKRYFGFVCGQGAAVVPADEIELQSFWPGWPWEPKGPSHSAVPWEITVPGPKPGFWKRQGDETPKLGDPLPVGFYGYNLLDRHGGIPGILYRNSRHGGPALVDAIKVSVSWAPFDRAYPVQRPFAPLEPIRKARFPVNKEVPDAALDGTQPPGGRQRLFTLDLRDWFTVEHEGVYRVALEIDNEALGFRGDGFVRAGGNKPVVTRDFVIGKEPQRSTIAEYNAAYPVLGGNENEQRLKRVIRETIKPKPVERKPLPARRRAAACLLRARWRPGRANRGGFQLG